MNDENPTSNSGIFALYGNFIVELDREKQLMKWTLENFQNLM